VFKLQKKLKKLTHRIFPEYQMNDSSEFLIFVPSFPGFPQGFGDLGVGR
jgi:hypothetical protein